MPTPFAHIGGHGIAAATVHIPGTGPWFAELDFEADPDVSGKVTLVLGELELVGTVDAAHDGTHGLQRRTRIVAGGGGWAKLLAAKHYHNDAGVRARTVAEDAAREAGETLGETFAPAAERVGNDYVRQSGPASRVLEDVIGAVPWWVDFDGATHAGSRAEAEADAGSYEVLEFSPAERRVELAVDDLRAIGIGSILSERLDAPQTVRELELDVRQGAVRIRAWTGGEAGARGRLHDLIRTVVARAIDGKLFGRWRYRVSKISGDRLELQAVRGAAGLPDLLPISMWPGVAGVHVEPAIGAEVLVEFIEGDRTMPIVTHFAGKDGVGWTPSKLIASASTSIKIGSASANEAAIKGDANKTAFDNFRTAHITWIELVRLGIVAGGGTLDNAAFTTAINTLGTEMASALSTKVEIE